jgi:drug/metabolite transporter (DMT)-like permease
VVAGLLLALCTSVAWAFGNVFIQKSGRAVGAPRAMLWALAVGGLLSAAGALLFDHRPASVTGAVLAWTAVAGISGLVAYACLFYAFARARLSVAVPLVSSWSLVAGALSIGVFGERARAIQLVGAAVVLAGVVLVSVGATREGGAPERAAGGATGRRDGRRRAWIVALGSAIAFGVMIPAMGNVAPALGPFGTAASVYVLGLLLALPASRRLGLELRLPPRPAWPVLLAAGVFETTGFVCITFARQYAPIVLVAPVASLSTALTVLYAWVVLRERPHPLAAAGALLASVGLVVMSV